MEALNKVKKIRPKKLEDIADAIVVEVEEGYMFLTEDGYIVGPELNRADIVAKAALYLAGQRSKNEQGIY